MASRLLQDIVPYARGEDLTPLKSRAGQEGRRGREGKAGAAFTLLSVHISSRLTTILNISTLLFTEAYAIALTVAASSATHQTQLY